MSQPSEIQWLRRRVFFALQHPGNQGHSYGSPVACQTSLCPAGFTARARRPPRPFQNKKQSVASTSWLCRATQHFTVDSQPPSSVDTCHSLLPQVPQVHRSTALRSLPLLGGARTEGLPKPFLSRLRAAFWPLAWRQAFRAAGWLVLWASNVLSPFLKALNSCHHINHLVGKMRQCRPCVKHLHQSWAHTLHLLHALQDLEHIHHSRLQRLVRSQQAAIPVSVQQRKLRGHGAKLAEKELQPLAQDALFNSGPENWGGVLQCATEDAEAHRRPVTKLGGRAGEELRELVQGELLRPVPHHVPVPRGGGAERAGQQALGQRHLSIHAAKTTSNLVCFQVYRPSRTQQVHDCTTRPSPCHIPQASTANTPASGMMQLLSTADFGAISTSSKRGTKRATLSKKLKPEPQNGPHVSRSSRNILASFPSGLLAASVLLSPLPRLARPD